jgi:hypothetical protein
MKFDFDSIMKSATADKRKLSLMLALLCLGLLLWGRLLIKDVPRTAEADGLAVASTVAVTPVTSTKEQTVRPLVEVSLTRQPHRDPFEINEEGYEKVERPKVVVAAPKSEPKQADEPDIKSLVNKAAANLKLQSVMLGDKPRALINGELVSPGQRIDGFEVKQIRNRQVTLEKSGIVIVLDM